MRKTLIIKHPGNYKKGGVYPSFITNKIHVFLTQ
jgi:hypothetical protein